MSDHVSLADVTPGWLTRVLRESGALREARVTSVEPELIGQFSNELWRLRVGYDLDEPEAPRSLVLKQPKPAGNPDSGQDLLAEIRFYRELGAGLPVRTPRLLFGSAPGEPARLLMDDVGPFEPLSFLRGASDEHASLALEALALLHAGGAGAARVADWVPSFRDPVFGLSLTRSYDRAWSRKRERFLALAPDFVPTGDALSGRVAASLAPLGAPAVLLHGDAHLENLALVRDDDGRLEVLFHDWAGARRGQPAFDVAVFLVMSFPPERRRELERARVASHAEALRRRAGPEVADPWHAYRLGVLAWSVRLVHFTRAEPRTDPLAEASMRMILSRCAAAAVELEVRELVR